MLSLLATVAVYAVSRTHHRRHGLDGPAHAPAREVVDAFPLAKAQTVVSGPYRYAVLGIGQDGVSGRDVVWMRDLSDARVGRFGVGEPLFDGPVRIGALSPRKLILVYHRRPTELVIHP